MGEGETLRSESVGRVGVIGGAGRVGFGLSLVLAQHGYLVYGIDRNQAANCRIMSGELPFRERGAKSILREALEKGLLTMTSDLCMLRDVDTVVVVIGTPVDENLNPVVQPLLDVALELAPNLRKQQLIVLRSTVAPGSTALFRQWLEKQTGWRAEEDFFVVFAPERVTEGNAIEEIVTLPQLIGAFSDAGYERACKFFGRFVRNRLFQLAPLEAEIGKLITNMSRYVEFALANEFYLICDSFGANVHRIFDACNFQYPRLQLPAPGPNVGGPCLYKDGFFLLERFPFAGLIALAFRINEGMPMHVVRKIMATDGIRKIAILGAAFKADIDDPRNSLSFKLQKQLSNGTYEVVLIDPLVPGMAPLEAAQGSDCAVLMTRHREFKDIGRLRNLIGNDNCLMVDIWGFWDEMRGKSPNGLFYLRELS